MNHRRITQDHKKQFIRKLVCINCQGEGHLFKDCKLPINSYGIIAFKKKENETLFLLIQRKDTMGYIDFVRGKYDTDLADTYKILIEEMTEQEKNRLLSTPFDTIWDLLWKNKLSRTYINEYHTAKLKFCSLDIRNMINGTETKWDTTEFGIAKGRKNNSETTLECAIREFIEETGYLRHEFSLNPYVKFEEVFYGSNTVAYRHVYFLAEIITERPPKIDYNCVSQCGEVKSVEWRNFKETINLFRSYDTTKRSVIYEARKYIENL